MTKRRSDGGTERTEESVTSASCSGGGGEGGGGEELLKRLRVEEDGEVGSASEGVCGRRSSDSAVGWEKLSPMALRVLLVEADDSTRQIISALLRKCGYRVSAVTNGLKAWEVLKGKPDEIDLILTEVDLPSVSGYALLSLIMDHEICKNIPVIMMSTEDSIRTAYKCMLKGAADYLIKPIRRNELGNLWQHVWRRQKSLGREIGMEDKDAVQDKLEPACENNASSKCSSGDGGFSQRNKECAEMGSDTQSSCMVLDADAVGSENVDKPAAACKNVDGMTLDNDEVNVDMDSKASDKNNANSTGEAIDFMSEAPLHIYSSKMKSEFDSYGHLDLSLRSSFRGGFEIEPAEGKNSLRHSSASSFTRYTGKQLYLQHSESAIVSNPKELPADSERNISGVTDTGGPSPGSISPVLNKESETEDASHQLNVLRTQDLVSGMRTDDIRNSGSSSMFTPFQSEQSVDASPPPNPCSPNFLEASIKSSDSTNETPAHQDKRSECSEEDQAHQGHVSTPVGDRSSSSSLCNGGASHNNSVGGYGSNCGSNSDVEQGAMIKVETESNKNEGGGAGSFSNVKSSTRSVQREAALAKFRLKRKERCFDKKVRYENRKMLADKRPRVKGQFVRQVPAAAPRLEVEVEQ
ncbi:unnamed protein product [Linum tenue]|uniref:Uncharacterized protein n=1 Tax=Linum tenue TaxID=586396 RepID=A0AAV0N3P8_9ROSI|nr:unnamed protein product [Linum tenue]